jgi:hypothetical protein
MKKEDYLNPLYILGTMIAEIIIARYLPTLNIPSHLKTNFCINISEEDMKNFDSLSSDWFNKQILFDRKKIEVNPKKEWVELKKFEKYLERKYLPLEIECRVPFFDFNDEELVIIKSGIRFGLWDCDLCDYKIETDDDIVIEEKDYYTDQWNLDRFVKLKLDLDKKIQYEDEV